MLALVALALALSLARASLVFTTGLLQNASFTGVHVQLTQPARGVVNVLASRIAPTDPLTGSILPKFFADFAARHSISATSADMTVRLFPALFPWQYFPLSANAAGLDVELCTPFNPTSCIPPNVPVDLGLAPAAMGAGPVSPPASTQRVSFTIPTTPVDSITWGVSTNYVAIFWCAPNATVDQRNVILGYTVTFLVADVGNAYNFTAINNSDTVFATVVKSVYVDAAAPLVASVSDCMQAVCITPFTVYQLVIETHGSLFSGRVSRFTRTLSEPDHRACSAPSLFQSTPTMLSFTSYLPLPLMAEPTDYIVNFTDLTNGTSFSRTFPLVVMPGPEQSYSADDDSQASLAACNGTPCGIVLSDGSILITLSGLAPYTNYSVRLSATYLGMNLASGWNSWIQPWTIPAVFATKPTFGAPITDLTITDSFLDPLLTTGDSDDPIAFNVTWTMPARPVGVVLGYEFSVGLIGPNLWNFTSVRVVPKSVTWMVFNVSTAQNNLRVRQLTTVGAGPWSDALRVPRDNDDDLGSSTPAASVQVVPILIGVLSAVIILAAIIVYSVFRRTRPRVFGEPDEWELPPCEIQLFSQIGSGAYGKVFRGTHTTRGNITDVAIKVCYTGAHLREEKAFLAEAALLKRVCKQHHPNIVTMIGVCTQAQPFWIVLEFLAHGDLKSYLQKQLYAPELVSGPIIGEIEKVRVLRDVMSAMKFLSSIGIVHCDLAARNVLLASDLTAKLSDLGMARELSTRSYASVTSFSDDALPVRWLAPEILTQGLYTIQSDVWSMGIVIWEVFADGEMPYPSLNNEEVLNMLVQGHRMARPPSCPETIWALALNCWSEREQRPTFADLHELINELLQQISVETEATLRMEPALDTSEPIAEVDERDVAQPGADEQSPLPIAILFGRSNTNPELSSPERTASFPRSQTDATMRGSYSRIHIHHTRTSSLSIPLEVLRPSSTDSLPLQGRAVPAI